MLRCNIFYSIVMYFIYAQHIPLKAYRILVKIINTLYFNLSYGSIIQIYVLRHKNIREVAKIMDINKAKEIISALAEGVDPTTGEVLPDTCVCNKGDVVRALYTVLNHLEDKKPRKNAPANAGKSWTKEEDDLLVHLYHSGTPKKDISQTLQRSESGIAARLVRLGIIENRDIFRERK